MPTCGMHFKCHLCIPVHVYLSESVCIKLYVFMYCTSYSEMAYVLINDSQMLGRCLHIPLWVEALRKMSSVLIGVSKNNK